MAMTILKPITVLETIPLVGTSPLLINKYADSEMDALSPGSQVSPRLKDFSAEFAGKLHLDDQGRPCFPASGLLKSLGAAASGKGWFGSKSKINKKLILGSLMMVDHLIPLEFEDLTAFRNMVVNKNAGGSAVVSIRPQFWPWSMDVRIEYDSGSISIEQIAQVFWRAGMSIGIGSWRPEKGGTFGRFKIRES